METRWQRWVDDGPPPAPVVDQQIQVRLRGGDSARRVVALARRRDRRAASRRSSDEIHFGERVGLIGPNGTGKTHLMRLLAGERRPARGTDRARAARLARPLHPAQHARRTSPARRARRRRSSASARPSRAMGALARYGLAGGRAAHVRDAVRRPAGAAGDPLPRARGPQPAAARRADRQPRHRLLRGARARARRLRGHGRRRLPRPRVPAPARPLPAARRRRRRDRAARPGRALAALQG